MQVDVKTFRHSDGHSVLNVQSFASANVKTFSSLVLGYHFPLYLSIETFSQNIFRNFSTNLQKQTFQLQLALLLLLFQLLENISKVPGFLLG